MKKILIIIGRLDVGGTEKHLLNIFSHLTDDYEISIFPLRSGGLLAAEYQKSELNVIQSSKLDNKLGLIMGVFKLCIFSLKTKPDIIHFFLPGAYIIGMFATILSFRSIKVMSRRSMNNYQERYPALKHIESFLHRHIDFVLGNSIAVTKQLKNENIEQYKIGNIYNGIDIPEKINGDEKSRLRKKYNIDEDAIVFIIVSNIIPYKGHQDLLKAFCILNHEIPDNWRLLIIGRDDGKKKELELLVIKNNLEKHIVWAGEIVDPSDYYKISDIGILPSHQEGFSNSLLEGMSYHLAMIATDVGGNAEAIIDGVSGLLIPPESPEIMAVRIKELVKDGKLKARLADAAYERVYTTFSKNNCIDMYRLFYSSILQNNELPKEIKV